MTIVLLSGPIAVGKSAVSKLLIDAHNFQAIRSGGYLVSLAEKQGRNTDRTSLQNLGDILDSDTDFRWIVDAASEYINQSSPNINNWILDSVRKLRQVEHFRNQFGISAFHVHLTAEEHILKKRYEKRLNAGNEYLGNTPYLIAKQHPNELSARSLEAKADLVINTGNTYPNKAAYLILEKLAGRG